MSIYFEKEVNLESIKSFLMCIFNVKEDEIKIFDQDYFFEKGYLEVDDDIKCLCTYRNVIGDVNLIIEIYRVDHQSPEFMIERVNRFFSHNDWNGFIVVENIDDDYLKISKNLTQPVYINDDLIDDGIIYFLNK